MKSLSSVLFLSVAVIVACIGCSVKEDRSACPCVLVLDLGGLERDMADSLEISVMSADGFLYKEVVHSVDYGGQHRVDVPRSGVWVNVYSVRPGSPGFGDCLEADGASLRIPHGMQCPAVNMFSSRVDTDAETAVVPVRLFKNYCLLTIKMLARGSGQMTFGIEGNVCGYDNCGLPVAGEFGYAPVFDVSGETRVRIPRQTDGSMRLLMTDKEGFASEFALGEYILESGYDWTEPDLKDVEIEIDWSLSTVTFTINDWVRTFDIEVVI